MLPFPAGSLAQKLDQLPAADSSERRVIILELVKEGSTGIGLTIVGGENTGRLDLGIFVRSITPGGPAERDGRVHPGDRIIAINGQSLEGMPHHAAVELIRQSPGKVQLMISQTVIPLAGSPFDGDSIPSLDEAAAEQGMLITGSARQLSKDGTSNHYTMASIVRPASPANSSDLELEDVVPSESLRPHHRRQQTPSSRKNTPRTKGDDGTRPKTGKL